MFLCKRLAKVAYAAGDVDNPLFEPYSIALVSCLQLSYIGSLFIKRHAGLTSSFPLLSFRNRSLSCASGDDILFIS